MKNKIIECYACIEHHKMSLLGLLVICWVANFLYSPSWGLYEDDWFFVARPYAAYFDLPSYVYTQLITWPQGRPLGFSIPVILSYIGVLAQDITILYFVAALILFINATLIYFLFLPFGSKLIAFLTAAFFLMSPFDTTRMFLTHAFQLQVSLMFSLIGLQFIIKKKYKTGYSIAALSLLTYETGYLIMVIAPYMAYMPLNLDKWKSYLKHYAVIGVIFVGYMLIRFSMNESRLSYMAGDGYLALVQKALLIIGRKITGSYDILANMFVQPFVNFQLTGLVVATVLVAIVFYALRKINSEPSKKEDDLILKKRYRDLFLLAIFIIVGGYLLTISLGWGTFYGRSSRANYVSLIGYSLLFATLFVMVFELSKKNSYQYISIAILAVFIYFQAYYTYKIQKDYVLAWSNQLVQLKGIIPLIYDVKKSDIILYSDEKNRTLYKKAGIASYSGGHSKMLSYLFVWGWPRLPDPLIVVTSYGWWKELSPQRDGSIKWSGRKLTLMLQSNIRNKMTVDNVIIIEATDEGFARYRYVVIDEGYKMVPDNIEKAKLYNKSLINTPLQKLIKVIFTEQELISMGLFKNISLPPY